MQMDQGSGKVHSVFLVSNETIARSGLKCLIGKEPEYKVIGESDTREAVESTKKLRPTVVLFHTTKYSSSQLISSIRSAAPLVGIVILGREINQSYLGLLLASGARSYLLLDASPHDLFHAMRAAAHGRRFIDPRLSDQVFELMARQAGGGTKMLSPREEQVLRLLAYGHTTKEIIAQLHVSRKSIETYQARIREKLGLRTRADIVRHALATGILNNRSS